MAEAQIHNGRAIVAYVDGHAVDSEGKPIEGAPKPPKDTDPSQQPGALGAPTAEERMGLAIAQAIANPKAVVAKLGANTGAGEAGQRRAAVAPLDVSKDRDVRTGNSATGSGTEKETALPTLAKLPRALKKLKTADEVRAMQATDDRAGAAAHYDARLAELDGASQ